MSNTESGTTLNLAFLSPSFTVNDLQKSSEFYVDALGFEIMDKHEVDGKVRFLMLKAGEAMVGLGQDDFAKGRDRVKGVGIRIWLATDQDVTVVAERAKAAGIKLDSEPEPMPWGPMGFALTDPDGFKLTISNRE